jgi:hypothetical protein
MQCPFLCPLCDRSVTGLDKDVVACGDVFHTPSPGGCAAGLSRRERQIGTTRFKLTQHTLPNPLDARALHC